MSSDTDTGFVYTLTDPRTDEVRYVGATENPKRRLRSHVQNPHSEALAEWVDDLDADDAVPEMRVINVAEIGELSDAEQSALDRLSERFELLNQQRRSGYDRRPTSKAREPSTTPITNSSSCVHGDFDPTEDCERVLDVFKDGRDNGDPWGRANPRYIIDETGMEKPNVEYHLRRLNDAGWVQKIARGLYEFVADPREDQNT